MGHEMGTLARNGLKIQLKHFAEVNENHENLYKTHFSLKIFSQQVLQPIKTSYKFTLCAFPYKTNNDSNQPSIIYADNIIIIDRIII